MIVISARNTGTEATLNVLQAMSHIGRASEQEDSVYMMTLLEAARQRDLAWLRLAKLMGIPFSGQQTKNARLQDRI